jgi:hypothetical protein
VVSNMAFIFHNIWDVILPIDELIFFKLVETPNQLNIYSNPHRDRTVFEPGTMK